MMNRSAVQLAHAYRSIGCSWAKIGTKFGISRRKIQKLLEVEVPTTQAASSSPTAVHLLRRKPNAID